MYKVVIADDERRIRGGLRLLLNWEELGFEVDEIFEDGQDIIEYLQYVVPDVILTDIKMNRVSGLEVAKYVCEHELPVRVILLSGYQEFELALQGLKYGVSDYLLKPADMERIEEVFLKIRKQLDIKTKEELEEQAETERMEEALPLLEERFFTDLVMGITENESYIRSCMKLLYPQIPLEGCCCFLADLIITDYDEFMGTTWKYNYDQFERNLSNFLKIYSSRFCFHIVFKAREIIELIGISTGQLPGETDEECEKGLEALVRELEQSFHFKCGSRIHRTYGSILDISRTDYQDGKNGDMMRNTYFQEKKKLIMSNLSAGNTVTARKLFHQILDEGRQLPPAKRNNLAIDVLSTMNELLKEINADLSDSLQSYFNYGAILSMGRMDDVRNFCDRIFDRIALAEEKKEYYDTGSLISKAKAYIRENIFRDISQEETANQLYICSSYLSRMFRKQTGESFIQYVTRVKMEKAVELLKDPRYKTYQVGEMLGYKTPRYFARLFRGQLGMNPSEYRKKVLHLGGEFDENI